MPAKHLNRGWFIALMLLFGFAISACAGPDTARPPESTLSGAAQNEPIAATPAHMPATGRLAPVVDRNGRMVVEALEYPWSAIGRINTGGRGFCTGVLIGPRLALASARCLFNATRGRWWQPSDIYFVAGYQRDQSVIRSRVRAYEIAPDFVPGAVNTFANIANNWALLRLDTPIGYAAGWLAVQWQGEETRARLAKGDGFLLAAGYRRGWGNAITVDLGCAERACAGSPVEAALPAFVYLDEEFRVLGNPLLRARAMAGGIGSSDFARMPRGDAHWGKSQPPAGSVAASALPRNSISRLLRHLGLLTKPERAIDDHILATAIRDFESESGLRDSGAVSVALLGHLLEAAVRELPRAKLRPQSWAQPIIAMTSAR
jgi:hypothetical protein